MGLVPGDGPYSGRGLQGCGMGARVAVIAGIGGAMLASGVGPAAADPEVHPAVRVIISGRLLGTPATVRVYDRHGVRDVRIVSSRTVRVSPGRVTFLPLPVVGEQASTARVKQLTIRKGTTVTFRYRRDTTSLPGLLAPVAVGSNGLPATGHGWTVSPDGTRVAFASDDPELGGGEPGLFVSELATGEVRRVAHSGSRVSWSPDSRRIAFATGADGVSFADIDTGEWRVVSAHSGRAQWTDDDHLVLSICRHPARCGIAVAVVASRTVRAIVPAAGRVRGWAPSPDGRRVLFESSEDPLGRGLDRRSLYIVDVDGTTPELLRANTRGGVVWSPDSLRVAFRAAAGSGRTRLLVKDLGSGNIATVAKGPNLRGPAVQWAPDSTAVAFRTRRGAFIERLATGRRQPLIPGRFTLPRKPEITGLTFSPSGNRIAFRFGAGTGCVTDVLPYADVNCSTVLVRDLRNKRIVNVSAGESGLGWRGRDTGRWSPAWLSERKLLINGPGTARHPTIKAVAWESEPIASPAPRVSPWCDPNRYWWSC